MISYLRGLILMLAILIAASANAAEARERIRFDDDWRFALGHATDPAKDFGHGTGYFSYLAKTGYGDGPANPGFDDRAFRHVNLPHDWAVELPFDRKGSASHGFKAIGRNFPENSVGWYRKRFDVPASDLGRRIRVELDGVYRNARVFVNGFFVGQEPSGYLGASYDVTEYLNYGGENTLVVRADATQEEGWFYEGAGIYRHVWLLKTDAVHVARHGTWVRTEVSADHASVHVETTVENDGSDVAHIELEQSVVASDGRVLEKSRSLGLTLEPGAPKTSSVTLKVSSPRLWSVETPVLHRLITVLRQGNRVIDHVETPFGIRTIHFDPNGGFFLNGKRVQLKGTNNHEDHAGVGVAVPDALHEHRLLRLKSMGSNAYRASHNPPTPELLDACDRLGMLVIDENRLMGVNSWHRRQLRELILRDRNHPSVILWSLGNEEWGIESNIKGERIARTLQDYARRLDPSRITTAAISGGWGGISKAVLAAGVNYIKQGNTDKQHADFPWQVILGTEETTTQATRGVYVEDKAAAHLAPLADGSSGGNIEIGWKHYAARPWAAGVFYWTGFDYRGEPTPYDFPAISSQFGILDTCGFPKDSYYYLKAWWTHEDVLHIFPHWNWPGREGKPVEVRVHGNTEEVELLLNGQSLGRKQMEPNGHLTWSVPYTPGTLLARGYRKGALVQEESVQTTGLAATLALSADRVDIRADQRDVAVVTVTQRDSSGRMVPTANARVDFRISGPGRILGVGNGDPSCHEADKFSETVRTVTLGSWKAPEAAVTTGALVFEAHFDAPLRKPGEKGKLLLNPLGPSQTVTLNGRVLHRAANPEQLRTELDWEGLQLKPKDNVLRVESAERFKEWHERERLALRQPAIIAFTLPAPPASRSTFNGLAQVIVQSTGAGAITLEASGAGVQKASLTLNAKN